MKDALTLITSSHIAMTCIHHVFSMMAVAVFTRVGSKLPTLQCGSTLPRTSSTCAEEAATTRAVTRRTTSPSTNLSAASIDARGGRLLWARCQFSEAAYTYGWRMTRALPNGKSFNWNNGARSSRYEKPLGALPDLRDVGARPERARGESSELQCARAA